MIASKKEIAAKNDNYKRLADYINDLSGASKKEAGQGEKVLLSWHAGCESENYEPSVSEVRLTQSRNTRAKSSKTYHLVVSFRPEDEAKLGPEIFKDIELEIAAELGYDTHQRHCGVRKNTNNVHMHLAYNMIDPVSHNRKAPYNDYGKLQSVCRRMEEKRGLATDLKREENKDKRGMPGKARAFEARTGQESFFSYAKSKKELISAFLDASESWGAFRLKLADVGLEAGPSRAGLVFKGLGSSLAIKASSVDRSLGLSKIEARLGKFEDAEVPEAGLAADRLRPGVGPETRGFSPGGGARQFAAYAASKSVEILRLFESSNTWDEFAKGLGPIGMKTKLRGNGIVFADLKDKYHVKASEVDRGLGLGSLEKKLGRLAGNETPERYDSKPLNNFPFKDDFLKRFGEEMEEKRRKMRLDGKNYGQMAQSLKRSRVFPDELLWINSLFPGGGHFYFPAGRGWEIIISPRPGRLLSRPSSFPNRRRAAPSPSQTCGPGSLATGR
ncbi:MAG: relaxase/mobilization nuclease domain-containing protein [Deltaproteobacteria bacterium]|jgi:hypothetical protein|nr:relaxase/mobilization nuclease domain-containing protein [Deltaproteobacteria bacterium]